MRPFLPLALIAALSFAPHASAAPILLEDGVGFVTVDPETEDFLTGWTVDGIAHLRTQGFWIRAGDAASETPLAALGAGAIDASDTTGDGRVDSLQLVYRGPNDLYEVQLRYALSGSAIGAPGLPSSQITLDVTLTALQADVSLALFQYTDVDLFTSFDDDASAGVAGGLAITDASGLGRYASLFAPSPAALEAAPYDTLLASLLDGAPTGLGSNLVVNGDVTFAAQWNAILAAGQSISFSQTQTIRVVPEPGVVLLLALGLAGLAARRPGAAR